jgi:hypothetical protein
MASILSIRTVMLSSPIQVNPFRHGTWRSLTWPLQPEWGLCRNAVKNDAAKKSAVPVRHETQ